MIYCILPTYYMIYTEIQSISVDIFISAYNKALLNGKPATICYCVSIVYTWAKINYVFSCSTMLFCSRVFNMPSKSCFVHFSDYKIEIKLVRLSISNK